MQQKYDSASGGFSLFELIIAMGLGMVVLSGALVLTSQAVGISDMVTQRSEMQQNARVAINMMARDLSLAGTGFPSDGIQLPSGTPSGDVFFAKDSSGCLINDCVYSQDRMFAVNPGDGLGPTINNAITDVVTLVYRDTTSDFDQHKFSDIDGDGKIFEFDQVSLPLYDPAYDDAIFGVEVGDVFVLRQSPDGFLAAAQVTDVNVNGEIRFMPNAADELGFNQPTAGFGAIKDIIHPPANPAFADTFGYRINVITYYIDATDPASPLLMRQVGAHAPVPVAENVENLQITYDIYDEDAVTGTAELVDAGGTPNLIRKVNITLTARSPRESMLGGEFQRVSLTTSIGPRNLTYKDRYE